MRVRLARTRNVKSLLGAREPDAKKLKEITDRFLAVCLPSAEKEEETTEKGVLNRAGESTLC